MILSREISTLQTTMKGKGDEEMQHIQVFTFTFLNFTPLIILSTLQVPHIMNARSIHELKRTSLKA